MSSESRRSARRTQAQVEADRASLEQAKADYESSILAAQAEVEGAKARVHDAEINLGYCRMSSPIDGRIGLAEVKLGNLVGPAAAGGGADYTELAVVRQLDPMGVDIPVASRYLDRVARLIAQGLPVEVFRPGLEGEEARRFPGKATVIDNTIDPTTSTFLIQAEVANPEKTILPGEYVKVNAKVGEARDAVVVPEQAVVETQAGPTVYTVDRAGQGGGRHRPGDLHPRGPPRPRIGPATRPAGDRRGAATGPNRDDGQDPAGFARRPDRTRGPALDNTRRRRPRGGEPRPTGDAGRCAGFGPGGRERRQGCRQARCAGAEAVSHDHDPGRARPDIHHRCRSTATRARRAMVNFFIGRADLRHGAGPADAAGRRHLRLPPADLALPGHRAAPGPGHHHLHRRRRPDRRRHRHDPDRAADQRRQGA